MTAKKNLNKMESLFLCDHFIIDKDNKASIIGIFDLIFATEKQFPFNYPGVFYLVGVVTGVPLSSHKMRAIITDEEGKKISESDLAESEFGGNGRTTFIHQFANTPIEKFGKLLFKLEIDGEIVGNTTVNVVKKS